MKIIINADDFGMTKSINKAIIELMKLGTVTSTSVMVNMPYAMDARSLLEIPGISIGLHFNLTDGIPVTNPNEIPSLVDEKGQFFTKQILEKRAKNNLIKKDQVLLELKNQYNELSTILGDNISHFDSHQGLNRIPVVFKALLDFGKENKRPAGIRFYVKYYIQNDGEIIKPGLGNIFRFGVRRFLVERYLTRSKKKINRFFKSPDGMLVANSHSAIDVFKLLCNNASSKYKNRIFEVPCHPAVDISELGNTKLTEERVVEYNLLKSDVFVKAAQINKFVSFNDVIV